MRLVTWQDVAVDLMGCAWLIRRFIDAHAEFLLVPAGTRPLPADAEPFEIPGVRPAHRRRQCTFHTMLREYELRDPVLRRPARIVDEADVVQEVAVEPVAPGLDLICRGLRTISTDDQAAIERGALVYEAHYARLAREGAAQIAQKGAAPEEA
jgi:hypothetical protein